MISPSITLSRKLSFFFFFNDTATTEIYTLSLHDALPIFLDQELPLHDWQAPVALTSNHFARLKPVTEDRKSTRLNSSHSQISYAVFCLKKKKNLPPTRVLLAPRVLARAGDYLASTDTHPL